MNLVLKYINYEKYVLEDTFSLPIPLFIKELSYLHDKVSLSPGRFFDY